jgi:hypothetical protein
MKGKTKMQTTTEATKTQQVIFDMLTTNTGSHMLDSGGDEGRHWQRNAKKTLADFMAEPYATIDPEFGDSSLSLFHYMSEYLIFNEGLTLNFEEFAKDFPEEPWLAIIEKWLDDLGIEEAGEFYSEARWSFNTYNFDLWRVNQTLQGSFFGLGKREYLIVQVHGGADVRGGYTAPKVFAVKRFYSKDEFILNAADISFTCSKCESVLAITGNEANFRNADGEERWMNNPESMPICECGGEWVA